MIEAGMDLTNELTKEGFDIKILERRCKRFKSSFRRNFSGNHSMAWWHRHINKALSHNDLQGAFGIVDELSDEVWESVISAILLEVI